MQKMLQNH